MDMDRRSFLSVTTLAGLSTISVMANYDAAPTNLEQWIKHNQCSQGTLELKHNQVIGKLSELSDLIQAPIRSNKNQLSFEHLGEKHELTLKVII